MGAAYRVSMGVAACACALVAAFAPAQSVTLTEPPAQLLPQSFGGWHQTTSTPPADSSISLTTVSKQALEECSPQRSQVNGYTRNGRTLRIEAVEFGDRTGAYSAFTLADKPEMKPANDLGSANGIGEGAVLFTLGGTVVLASPATAADLPSLRELAKVLPKISDNRGVAPLLPSFVPSEHLVPGTIRYALGPATYAAEGGVLPANSLGWDKSGEAITATYNQQAGTETLTLLLYPTPQIAEAFEKKIASGVKGMGPTFANAAVRRENELVMMASGALPMSDAQAMVAGVHMRQEVAIDRYMPPVFHAEVQKTVSLLTNIAVLASVLMGAAVLLGLFLGGGRAAIRILQGKPAATEPEFLSLHLATQNPSPIWESRGSKAGS